MKDLRNKAKNNFLSTLAACMQRVEKDDQLWWQCYYLLKGRVAALSELGLLGSSEANALMNKFFEKGGLEDEESK